MTARRWRVRTGDIDVCVRAADAMRASGVALAAVGDLAGRVRAFVRISPLDRSHPYGRGSLYWDSRDALVLAARFRDGPPEGGG